MVSLYSPPDNPCSDNRYIAIGIREYPDSCHIGILYRIGSSSDVIFLHLPWHNALQRDTSLDPSYSWTRCDGLSEAKQRMLGIWLERVWAINGEKITYGLYLAPTGYFDDSAKFIPSGAGVGLTCATFVMSMFSCLAISIVDIESWKKRQADRDFHTFILKRMLEDKRIHPDHFAAQVKHFGTALRFRAEEVAAAASLYKGNPVHFDLAVPAGADLVAQLRSRVSMDKTPAAPKTQK